MADILQTIHVFSFLKIVVLIKISHAISYQEFRWQDSICVGNGLVISGSKPLPEPMLSQIYDYDALWHPYMTSNL